MATEPDYMLTRGMYSSMRLNLQHYLWKDVLGYLLHPTVPVTHPENLKIADLGTGTGVWLLDLARTLPPTAELSGFDVSSAQFPCREHLPGNVHLSVLDSFSTDVPSELVGKFDIVHLRLFVGVVSGGDPSPLLTHALRLLRPGGYLQWDEFDPTRTTAVGPHGGPAPHSEAIVRLLRDVKKTDWIFRLADYFTAHGLEQVGAYIDREKPWLRKLASDMVCALGEEIVSASIEPRDAEKARDLRASIKGAYAEVCAGAWLSQPFNVIVGHKPEDAGTRRLVD